MQNYQKSSDIWKVVAMVAIIIGVLGGGYATYGAYRILNAEKLATVKAREVGGFLGGGLVPQYKKSYEADGKKRLLIGGIGVAISIFASSYAKNNS